jgi:hypothetical protein
LLEVEQLASSAAQMPRSALSWGGCVGSLRLVEVEQLTRRELSSAAQLPKAAASFSKKNG